MKESEVNENESFERVRDLAEETKRVSGLERDVRFFVTDCSESEVSVTSMEESVKED